MGTIRRISRLGAAVLGVVGVLLLVASAAYSQPKRAGDYAGFVIVRIQGRGSVKLNKGFVQPQTLNCSVSCPRNVRLSIQQTRGPRVVLTAKPAEGWKSAGWRGSCMGKTRLCAINLARVRPTSYGARWANVTAQFLR